MKNILKIALASVLGLTLAASAANAKHHGKKHEKKAHEASATEGAAHEGDSSKKLEGKK